MPNTNTNPAASTTTSRGYTSSEVDSEGRTLEPALADSLGVNLEKRVERLDVMEKGQDDITGGAEPIVCRDGGTPEVYSTAEVAAVRSALRYYDSASIAARLVATLNAVHDRLADTCPVCGNESLDITGTRTVIECVRCDFQRAPTRIEARLLAGLDEDAAGRRVVCAALDALSGRVYQPRRRRDTTPGANDLDRVFPLGDLGPPAARLDAWASRPDGETRRSSTPWERRYWASRFSDAALTVSPGTESRQRVLRRRGVVHP
ncbi:MAG: hypothetical protein ACRD29_07690 [Acidimicrobiales bacterium]